MSSPGHPELDALMASERYEEALSAAEAALAEQGGAGLAGDDGAQLRTEIGLHLVAIQAAYHLGRDEARRHAFAMLRCAKELGDDAEQIRAHNALAVAYGSAGRYDEASQHLWTVAQLREASGSAVEPQELNNLGLVYLELERFDEATALFTRAVDAFRAIDDGLNAELSRVNLAAARRAAGQPDVAVPILHESLTVFEQLGLQTHVVSTLAQLAQGEAALGRPERALATFERALALVAAGHAARHEHPLRVALARVALDNGDATTAVAQLERVAAALADASVIHHAGVLPLLSRAYEALGRIPDALDALKRHVEQLEHDDRRSATTAAQLRMLELEYGVGGEQEISRLRTAELERMNAALGRRTAELERLSMTDALTGLPNRRAFDERLREALASARRHQRPLVVALLDFDRFKLINDRYGHELGDAVLVEGAAVVRRSLRASDVAARWGGEEFALLLPDTGRAAALRILDRLRRAVASVDWAQLEVELVPTVSIGAAALDEVGDEVDDEAALLRLADRRLFAAKRAGRDRVVAADA